MAGSWTSERFPQFEEPIMRLIAQHQELEDEPLHLAVTYLPARRDQQHIYLLEVITNRIEGLNPERDLFEVSFLGSDGFPMSPDEELHLILTNPRELDAALKQKWPVAGEVVNAIRDGDFKVLYQDQIGEQLMIKLRAEVGRQETVGG